MLKEVETIVMLGLAGAGLYIAYNIVEQSDGAIGQGVGKITSGVGALAQAGANTVDILDDALGTAGDLLTSDVTYGEGERCVNNPECSINGVAGGRSVGLDAFGNQEYGCCLGRCKKKPKGLLGNYVCPNDAQEKVERLTDRVLDRVNAPNTNREKVDAAAQLIIDSVTTIKTEPIDNIPLDSYSSGVHDTTFDSQRTTFDNTYMSTSII